MSEIKDKYIKNALRIYEKTFYRIITNHIFKYLLLKINSPMKKNITTNSYILNCFHQEMQRMNNFKQKPHVNNVNFLVHYLCVSLTMKQ